MFTGRAEWYLQLDYDQDGAVLPLPEMPSLSILGWQKMKPQANCSSFKVHNIMTR